MGEIRTRDLMIAKQTSYHLSYCADDQMQFQGDICCNYDMLVMFSGVRIRVVLLCAIIVSFQRAAREVGSYTMCVGLASPVVLCVLWVYFSQG